MLQSVSNALREASAGPLALAFLGRYWKLFAGLVAVLFGLATLKLLPFTLPGHVLMREWQGVDTR